MLRLVFLAFLSILLLAGCGNRATPPEPRVVAGELDLTRWDFDRDGAVALDGEWLLEWDEFADPRAPAAPAARPVAVPSPWHAVSGSRQGRGTYRVTVQCGRGTGMALSLPLQHSAARWFVNGALVARQGEPGASQRGAQPMPVQQTVALGSMPCPFHIVAHVSNFDMERGGLVRSVELGDVTQLAQRRELALMRDLLAVGGLLVLGVMPVLFFLKRPADRSPLWFGLLCLVFALGMALTGTRILQPVLAPLGWTRYLQLVFLCWYSIPALFAVYVRSLYPGHIATRPIRVLVAWVVVSCVLVLSTSSAFFTRLVPLLSIGSALSAAYIAWGLLKAVRGGRRTARLLLVALGVLAAAVVYDSLNYTHLWRLSLLPYAVMIFVGVPAYLMAGRFARALLVEERTAIELRERADLLVRSTKAGLLNWDAIGNRTTYSDRYREMLGYTPGPEAGELPEFIDQVHPDDREAVEASFRGQLRDRTVKSGVRPGEPMDYRLRSADGEYLWIHAEAVSVCDAQGRILRYICSFIDISQNKRHEAEMSNRIKFTNDLFDSVPLGLALRDPGGKHLFVNRTWERNIGLPRDQVLGVPLQDIDIAQAQAALALDREALEAGGRTLPSREADYQGRRFMQTRTAMMDAQGQAIGVLIASLDISEKHAVEQALRTEQRRLDLVVRGAQVGIVDWDGLTHATYYSPRFREILGHAPDADTSGWPDYFGAMVHPEDRERVTRRWVAFIQGKGPEGPRGDFYAPDEYRLARADGGHAWVRVSGIAVRDEKDFVVRWIAAVIDVTERRAHATLLEQQNEALKENVRLREEVERIGRHDIKTPLNSIVAVPRLLREERRLSPEADELLGIVERAGYRILSMVNLSLDLYKMEQGSYTFRPDAVDLADLVDKVLADVRMHAASKGVRFEVDLGGAPYAWAEELLCYSLLANLIKNAVEASPEGEVVGIRAEAGPDGSVALHVRNRGAVPQAIRAHFFEKYATLGKASGTGLGTYSARLMARVQDGDIAMRTSDDEGTTLSVSLRAAPEGVIPTSVRHASERDRAEAPQQLTGLPELRVLLVDDDEYNLLIVRRFLPAPPLIVETAINGRMALAAADRQWPDVIFMDLDMPVMGGMQAVQELRAMERARGLKRCMMFALSSHEDEATQSGALAAGFDRYLTKPVTREVVHETLLEVTLGVSGPPVRRLAAAPAAAVDPVLVDADMQSMLGEYLVSRRGLIRGLAGRLAAGEREELRRTTHQLAGSFGLYGFKWASDQCRWIEKNFADVDAVRLDDIAGRLDAHLDTADIRFVATDSLEGEET
jgi:PAS domain S-box-containing protein